MSCGAVDPDPHGSASILQNSNKKGRKMHRNWYWYRYPVVIVIYKKKNISTGKFGLAERFFFLLLSNIFCLFQYQETLQKVRTFFYIVLLDPDWHLKAGVSGFALRRNSWIRIRKQWMWIHSPAVPGDFGRRTLVDTSIPNSTKLFLMTCLPVPGTQSFCMRVFFLVACPSCSWIAV